MTGERLAGFIQGQALFAVFGQGVAPINGLVFLRIVNHLKLLLDRRNTKQGGIQTARHFLVVGPGVALQVILDKILLHLYDRFRIAAGRDLLDMGNQGLSGINQLCGAWHFPVPLNSYRFIPQQALSFLGLLLLCFLRRAQSIPPASRGP